LLELALVFPLQPSVNAPESKVTAKSLFMSNSLFAIRCGCLLA
jgi:hypothetical protein